MQGNKLDEQFVDKAWGEMRALLDKEMPLVPEEKKKKRGFWFFLVAGLLISGSLLGYWLTDRQKEDVQPTTVHRMEAPVANLSTKANPSKSSTTPSTTSTTTTATVSENRINSPATTIIPPSVSNQSIGSGAFFEKESIVTALENQITPLSDPERGLETKTNTSTNPVQPKAELKQVQPITVPAAIAMLAPSALNYAVQVDLPAISIEKKKGRFFKRLGLEMGAISNQFNPLDGYSIGLRKDIALGKGRFALSTGLAYRRHSGSNVLLSNQTYSLDYANFDTAFDPNGSNTPNAIGLDSLLEANSYLAKVTRQETVRLQYIDLPVRFSYALNKKLRIESGVRASWLISAFRQLETASGRNENFALQGVGNFFAPEADTYRVSEASNTSFRNLDLAASLGLTYYPTRKIGFSLYYDHGFRSINATDYKGNANRNLHLSAIYFLK